MNEVPLQLFELRCTAGLVQESWTGIAGFGLVVPGLGSMVPGSGFQIDGVGFRGSG